MVICRVAWWKEIPLLFFFLPRLLNSYYSHGNEIAQHLLYDIGNQHVHIFIFQEYMHLFLLTITKVPVTCIHSKFMSTGFYCLKKNYIHSKLLL